jgi:hypothetical protein
MASKTNDAVGQQLDEKIAERTAHSKLAFETRLVYQLRKHF